MKNFQKDPHFTIHCITEDIIRYIKKNEFIFLLQPQYELNTRKIIGAEALVRWNHPALGEISPAVFIPVLENNGYITKLDQKIWEDVCAMIRRWIDEGIKPLASSINVTKTDLLAMDVVEIFDELLKKYRIPPKYLNIDIAENAYKAQSTPTTPTMISSIPVLYS